MQNTDYPANQNQNSTELGVHNDCVVQGVADGHKAVIGHTVRRRSSNPANSIRKYTWMMQAT